MKAQGGQGQSSLENERVKEIAPITVSLQQVLVVAMRARAAVEWEVPR